MTARGLAEDPLLDRLALAVQLLQLRRDPVCGLLVAGQQQLERRRRPAQAAGGVDPRREPEADGALVDDGRVDAGCPHQRLQARPGRRREPTQAGDRQRAVLVDERDDVGDRREGDEVEVADEPLVTRPEQRLGELVDDPRAAELGERVGRGPGRDDRAIGERVARAMVVGDDHVEPRSLGSRDLVDGGDSAVDGQHEPAAFPGQTRERLAGEAVALLEAAGQVPVDVGAELAEDEDREGRSRRCRRRRSRRGRRSSCRPRPRRGSGRRPPACRRGRTGRVPAARRRGTTPPVRDRRIRGGRARSRSCRSGRERRRAMPPAADRTL